MKSDRLVLDTYVLDTLMPDLVGHDRRPSAFLVYLYLWGRGRLARRRGVRVSLQHMAADTGLSKSAVQAAIRLLQRRRLLRSEHTSATSVPEYFVERPWKRRAEAVSPRARADARTRPPSRRG